MRRIWGVLVGLALLAVLAWVVSSTLSENERNRDKREQASRAYNYYARTYLGCAAASDPTERNKCMEEQYKSAAQQYYTSAGLDAQQDVATWNFGLFWLGVITFIPGSIGLILLVENILVVREQMREAERVSHDQSKAYLAASSCRLTWEKGGHPKFHITYKNGGQTPAVRVREVICFRSDDRPPDWAADNGIPRGIMTGNSSETVERFFEAFKLRESFEPSEPEVLLVWIYAFYEDVHGSLYRSGTTFVVSDKDVDAGVDIELVVYHQQAEPLFQMAPVEEQVRYRETIAARKAPLIRRVKKTNQGQ